jgi:hypothetical protein
MNGHGRRWKDGRNSLNRSQVIDLIKNYFISNGSVEESVNDDTLLAFSNGKTRTIVKILSLEDLEDRSVLIQALLRAASNLTPGAKTYVAMPKLLSAVIDGKTLEDIGLGLLTYSEKNIDEIIPAKIREFSNQVQNSSIDPTLADDLQRLWSEVAEVKTMVSMLKREVSNLKDSFKIKPSKHERKEVNAVQMSVPSQQPENLPMYFQDNPWISVLSQRGGEADNIAS